MKKVSSDSETTVQLAGFVSYEHSILLCSDGGLSPAGFHEQVNS